VSFHGRHKIVWMTPNFWTVVYVRYIPAAYVQSTFKRQCEHNKASIGLLKDCTTFCGTQPNGWCKILHCLARWLISCGRMSRGMPCVSTRAFNCECTYSMLWKARFQMVTDYQLRGKVESYECVCVCVSVWLCVGNEVEGSFWLCGEPIYGSSSRAPCVSHCHFQSHTAE